ncbi:hypothetical protein [Murimonas intestini]|uniref:hypothetical protein n=1 Tax=Murimonas intestini TaxID=1337051 RepID=UPI0011DE3419|nr:hypothetical protein [Murimonas intestini]
MSESNQHQKLVNIIIEHISNIVGAERTCFIESDVADGHPLPQLTPEGFRPDVMYQYENVLFIGEAKTIDDVVKTHSLMQYESYIKKCSLFTGKATLIIAVPWMEYATVYNITHQIKKRYPGDYVIKIIKGIGV